MNTSDKIKVVKKVASKVISLFENNPDAKTLRLNLDLDEERIIYEFTDEIGLFGIKVNRVYKALYYKSLVCTW